MASVFTDAFSVGSFLTNAADIFHFPADTREVVTAFCCVAAVNLTAAGKLVKPKVNLVGYAKDLPIPVCVLETRVEATANEMFPQ